MQKKYATSVLVLDDQNETMNHDALVVEADSEQAAIDVTHTWAREDLKQAGVDPHSVSIHVKAAEVTGGVRNVDIRHDSKLFSILQCAPTPVRLWSPTIEYGPVHDRADGTRARDAQVRMEEVWATADNGFLTIAPGEASLWLPKGSVREDVIAWARTETGAYAFLRDVFMEQAKRAEVVRLAAARAVAGYDEIVQIASARLLDLQKAATP